MAGGLGVRRVAADEIVNSRRNAAPAAARERPWLRCTPEPCLSSLISVDLEDRDCHLGSEGFASDEQVIVV